MTQTLNNLLRELWTDEAGAVAVEYAMLTAILVIGTMQAWVGMRVGMGRVFDRVVVRLSD